MQAAYTTPAEKYHGEHWKRRVATFMVIVMALWWNRTSIGEVWSSLRLREARKRNHRAVQLRKRIKMQCSIDNLNVFIVQQN
jgi:hypothetical protein